MWSVERPDAKGTDGQANAEGALAPNFNLPDTDSIGTWGSKLQEAAGNDDLNSLAGQTTTTSSSSATTAENRISQMEGFIQSQHNEMSHMKSMFNTLMQKIGDGSTPDNPVDPPKDAGSQVASPAALEAPPALPGGAEA